MSGPQARSAADSVYDCRVFATLAVCPAGHGCWGDLNCGKPYIFWDQHERMVWVPTPVGTRILGYLRRHGNRVSEKWMALLDQSRNRTTSERAPAEISTFCAFNSQTASNWRTFQKERPDPPEGNARDHLCRRLIDAAPGGHAAVRRVGRNGSSRGIVGQSFRWAAFGTAPC